MISLQFENLNDLFLELEDKIDGIEQLVSRETKSQIAKAVFTITTKKFIKDMNMQAVLNPAKYFHMYEWNAVGNTNKKLFEVKRQSISDGNLKINISYKPSKTAVPIPPELKIPGKKGKSAKKRSVFVNKAEVMESGRPVSFTTKQFIVFLSQRDNKMRFIRPNKTVRIQQPGGKLTTRAFDKFLTRWYAKEIDSVIRASGMFDQIGKKVAVALNQKRGGKVAARKAIKDITEKYSQGVTEL